MRALAFASILVSFWASACAPAAASLIDGDDDVHCSVIASYHQRLAQRINAPEDQQNATQAVHEWYASKMRTIAAKDGPESLKRRVEPVLQAVQHDPLMSRDALVRCTDRALAEGLS